jgi:hypothetical protein
MVKKIKYLKVNAKSFWNTKITNLKQLILKWIKEIKSIYLYLVMLQNENVFSIEK